MFRISKCLGSAAYFLAMQAWKLEVKLQALSLMFLRKSKPVAASPAEVEPYIFYGDEIKSANDVVRLMKCQNMSSPVLLSADKIIWGYGYSFPVYNPYILELQLPGFLECFYKNFQPLSVYDAWFPRCAKSDIPDDLFVDRKIPWLPWNAKEGHLPSNSLAGSCYTHGVALRGPVSKQKLTREKYRLHSLFDMIRVDGYRPDIHGHIVGQFLLKDLDWRFVCTGGNHRLAVLAVLGYTKIPVVRTHTPPGGGGR